MNKVLSRDGTPIAYDRSGQGPALILVDGALCYRAFGPSGPLAALLAPHFTAITYDRRGRGDSGDTKPYTLQREVEDIEALIEEVGGSAFVFGTSSGGCLALEAALKLGSRLRKLAVWEPPYNSEPGDRQAWQAYWQQLNEFLAKDRRGDAVALFMKRVGTPGDQIEGMRQLPMWAMLEAIAPTLAYDATAMGGKDISVPAQRAAGITVPALAMSGTVLPSMLETAEALAKAMPHGQLRTLEGQAHDVSVELLAPPLVEFFTQ